MQIDMKLNRTEVHEMNVQI